jgi:hypothetical protein
MTCSGAEEVPEPVGSGTPPLEPTRTRETDLGEAKKAEKGKFVSGFVALLYSISIPYGLARNRCTSG